MTVRPMTVYVILSKTHRKCSFKRVLQQDYKRIMFSVPRKLRLLHEDFLVYLDWVFLWWIYGWKWTASCQILIQEDFPAILLSLAKTSQQRHEKKDYHRSIFCFWGETTCHITSTVWTEFSNQYLLRMLPNLLSGCSPFTSLLGFSH